MGTATTANGGVSFWYSTLGVPQPGQPLDGSTEVDVCVVGGGYTGLWTAYYLKKADPSLRIAVLEQRFCGYGASGRNGGWLYGGFAGRGAFARSHGKEAAIRMQRAMNASVDEVIRVAAAEAIEAGIVKGGVLEVARSRPQLARLEAFVAEEHAFGQLEQVLLSADEAAEQLAVAARWPPVGARTGPGSSPRSWSGAWPRWCGRWVCGCTRAPRSPRSGRRGRRPGAGRHRAGHGQRRLRAAGHRGLHRRAARRRRTWLPMNSSMIVTEPLPPSFWAEVGWQRYDTLGDLAHAYMYAQRTADDRIALGGRGVPYRFGSRTDHDGGTAPRTVRQLRAILDDFFPAAAEVGIAHAWSGVLGVPRDWCCTVELDPHSGLGWAGGYVGSGVTTANLAGRTLRDLVLRATGAGGGTELTALPWVGHTVRRWEPEPLRWLGVHGMYAAYHAADRQERGGRATTSPIARVADRIAGRH